MSLCDIKYSLSYVVVQNLIVKESRFQARLPETARRGGIKRIALFASSVLILLCVSSSSYADELSVAGGTGASGSSCNHLERDGASCSFAVLDSPGIFAVRHAGQGRGGTSYFPVIPRGAGQFDVDGSKLGGEHFRWHFP